DLISEIPAHSSGIKKVCTSPATGDILSAAYDQRICIWDAQTLRLRTELQPAAATWERSLNWAPDGRSVLAGTLDGTVLVWAPETGCRTAHLGNDGGERGNACFNEASAGRDGELVAVSDDGYIRLATLTPEVSQWHAKVEPSGGPVLMNAVTFDG